MSDHGQTGTQAPRGPEPDDDLVRVLVVDDSAFMRRALRTMLESDPRIEVVDAARNGRDGVERAEALHPDVITLDVEMPEMDGLTALREIRLRCKDPRPAVLMCSSLTSEGSHEALKAMRLGAADVIGKDPGALRAGDHGFRDELIAKVLAIAPPPSVRKRPDRVARIGRRPASVSSAPPPVPVPVSPVPALQAADYDLVVIGSSTGGPPVLETILCALPSDLPVPVVVAQHMPAMFTRSLAQRLDHHAALNVVQGEDGIPLVPGTVYIAEGGLHARIRRAAGATGRMSLEVSPEPTAALYRPSVNELFASAARACGRRTLGVMLTGMGDDGVRGSHDLVNAGGRILAQHERTCVVYGMPRAVVEKGLAAAVLEPDGIAAALRRLAPHALRAAG